MSNVSPLNFLNIQVRSTLITYTVLYRKVFKQALFVYICALET